MLFRKSFTEFSFVSFKDFIFTLMRRHGFQSIVFSPEPENVDLFSANQLTHAAPKGDIEDPGGFIHVWRQNQTQVRRVSFTYSPIGGAFGIEMTIDLDERIISLVRATNRTLSDQVKVVLEETFSGLQDVDETRRSEGTESEDIGSVSPIPWHKNQIVRGIFVTAVGSFLAIWLASVFWPSSGEPESESIPSADISTPNPVVVQPPVGIQGEPRQWLRDEHKVRPLIDVESGLEISETPPGIFGFVSGIDLAFDRPLKLDRSHDFGDDFELHKLVGGSVYVIGFVGIDIAALLRRDVWPQKINFIFYSDALDNTDKIVALPLDEDRIRKRFRSIELDNGTHLDVLDITMD